MVSYTGPVTRVERWWTRRLAISLAKFGDDSLTVTAGSGDTYGFASGWTYTVVSESEWDPGTKVWSYERALVHNGRTVGSDLYMNQGGKGDYGDPRDVLKLPRGDTSDLEALFRDRVDVVESLGQQLQLNPAAASAQLAKPRLLVRRQLKSALGL